MLFGDDCINFAVVILADDALPEHIPGKAHGGLIGSQSLAKIIHSYSPPFSEPRHNNRGSSNGDLSRCFEMCARNRRK